MYYVGSKYWVSITNDYLTHKTLLKSISTVLRSYIVFNPGEIFRMLCGSIKNIGHYYKDNASFVLKLIYMSVDDNIYIYIYKTYYCSITCLSNIIDCDKLKLSNNIHKDS